MNTGHKQTTVISAFDAKKALTGADIAFYDGHPLNTAVTIHLDKARVSSDPSDFITAFNKYIADWLRTRGSKLYHFYTQENPSQNNRHFHMALHIPDELKADFAEHINNRHRTSWLCKSGGTYSSGVISYNVLSTREDQVTWIFYILKGAHPDFFKTITRGFHSPQGTTYGIRCGVSQSLNAAAVEIIKKDTGFIPDHRLLPCEFTWNGVTFRLRVRPPHFPLEIPVDLSRLRQRAVRTRSTPLENARGLAQRTIRVPG